MSNTYSSSSVIQGYYIARFSLICYHHSVFYSLWHGATILKSYCTIVMSHTMVAPVTCHQNRRTTKVKMEKYGHNISTITMVNMGKYSHNSSTMTMVNMGKYGHNSSTMKMVNIWENMVTNLAQWLCSIWYFESLHYWRSCNLELSNSLWVFTFLYIKIMIIMTSMSCPRVRIELAILIKLSC